MPAASSTATTSTTSRAMRVLRFIPRLPGFAGAPGGLAVAVVLPLPVLVAGLPAGSVFGSVMAPRSECRGQHDLLPFRDAGQDLGLAVAGGPGLDGDGALGAVGIQDRDHARPVLRAYGRAGDGEDPRDLLGEDLGLGGHAALEARIARWQDDSHIVADHAGDGRRRGRHREPR